MQSPSDNMQHTDTVPWPWFRECRGCMHVGGHMWISKPENLSIRDWQDLSRLHCSVHDLGESREQFCRCGSAFI